MKINLDKPARVSESSLLTEESRKTSHERNGSIKGDLKYRLYATIFGLAILGAVIGILWFVISVSSTVATTVFSGMVAPTIKEPVDPSPVPPQATEEKVADSFMEIGDKVQIKQIQYFHYQYNSTRDYYLVGLSKKKVLDWYEIEPKEVIYDADKVSYIERKKDKVGTFSNYATYVIHLTDQFPMIIVPAND